MFFAWHVFLAKVYSTMYVYLISEVGYVREAPLRKFLSSSGLVNKETSVPKVEPMDIDVNAPSTSNKKSQRSTPDGSRKPSRGK